MRLQIDGGKTEFDGVYAQSKYSTLTISKSKVSPIMNDIPIIIDITKGGVVDRGGSLVWWMTQVNPSLFKQAAWWSIEDWCYQKYKIYWDKFEGFSNKFRQTHLYDLARSNESFCDFLQLIWIDLISERYVLQSEVCKEFREKIVANLMLKLGITYEELDKFNNGQVDEINTEVSEQDLNELSSILNVDPSTGEVIE